MHVELTKFTHSCLLVKVGDTIALFDPGTWSVNAGLLKTEILPKLNYIVYTHEHQDHLNTDFLKSILELQQPTVVCNESIEKIITDAGIHADIIRENEDVVASVAPHGELPVPGAVAPDNQAYHFMDTFTHAGDSHTLTETKAILAIASIAPWGKTGDMVNKVLELKPKYVLPIHDWHYSTEAKTWLNNLLAGVYENTTTKLITPTDGKTLYSNDEIFKN